MHYVRSITLSAVAAVCLGLASPGSGFEWQADYEAALAQASAEKKVVFVMADFEGEARCDYFLDKLTKDKQLRALAENTLNIPVASEQHRKKGDCSRFDGVECADHRRLLNDLTGSVLLPNEEGVLAMPQFIWLNGNGEVLLSVPFEVNRDGLVWCFEAAMRLADPEGASPFSEEARPPRRLVMGGTFTPEATDELARGLTPDELEQELAKAKQSWIGGLGVGETLRVMFTDEKDAVDYVKVQLTFLLEGFARDRIGDTLHALGMLSPESYWEVLEKFAEMKNVDDRHEIAVALEQLGASDALKFVKSLRKKEKDPLVARALVRALGASGSKDKATRKVLIKIALGEENDAMRASSAFAMGYLRRGDDIREAWFELLAGESPELAVAAASGAALARDELCIAKIEQAAKNCPVLPNGANKAALEAAVAVLRGGNLLALQDDVERVTGDRVARERIFFGQTGLPTPTE
jgi:hypothetical protein